MVGLEEVCFEVAPVEGESVDAGGRIDVGCLVVGIGSVEGCVTGCVVNLIVDKTAGNVDFALGVVRLVTELICVVDSIVPTTKFSNALCSAVFKQNIS